MIGGKPDELLGEKAVLLIESEQNPDFQTEPLLDLLSKDIPKYQIPKEIHFIKTFEKTPSGKINRLKTLEKIK
jgi:O-succinylbenzoic acid--CoA ligase